MLCRRPCVTTDPIGPRTPAAPRPRAKRAAIGAKSGRESDGPNSTCVRADPVGRQPLLEQAMEAFVGELRATGSTSVAAATPPIPTPATTAPRVSSHHRGRLPACVARGAVIGIGSAAVFAVALIALTLSSAAPVRDIRASALDLRAARSVGQGLATVPKRAALRAARPLRAPATHKRHAPTPTRRPARDPVTRRPVSTTRPAGSSLVAVRRSLPARPRTSALVTPAPSPASEFLP